LTVEQGWYKIVQLYRGKVLLYYDIIIHIKENGMIKKMAALICTLVFLGIFACTSTGTSQTQNYAPGTYTATVPGRNGPLTVNVTFAAHSIANAEVTSHVETAGFSDEAVKRIPANVVTHQSLGIDTISGATLTSNAILAAIADCVKQAGGDAEALKAVSVTKQGGTRTLNADLVIVGGGVGGVSAALAAVEEGIGQVILVEKNSYLGGSAFVSGGVIQGAGARAQAGKTSGEPDYVAANGTVKELTDYWIGIGSDDSGTPRINVPLVTKVAGMSGDSIDWLHDTMNVKYYKNAVFQGEAVKPYGLYGANNEVLDRSEIQYGGRFLMQPMIDKLKTTRVQLLMETEVTQLTKANGRISGVIAQDKVTGSTITINAKAVILAVGSTAQGQTWARDAGVAFRAHTDAGVTGTMFGFGSLYVNRNGERFVNEAGFYERVFKEVRDSNAAAGLNNGDMRDDKNYYCFMIVDSVNRKKNTKPHHTPSGRDHTWDELLTEAETYGTPAYRGSIGPYPPGEVYSGSTLAEAFGNVPASLMSQAAKQRAVQTVAAYNADLADGTDDAFGKDIRDRDYGDGAPVGNTGPYYVWRIPIFSRSYPDEPGGGMPIVNTECEMVDSNGRPVPGLYGSGTITSNEFKYAIYTGSGTYIQFGVSMGRISARSAAEYIKTN
jgi:fumarate reductase flavoprotein subunit